MKTLTSPTGDLEAVILLDSSSGLRVISPARHGVGALGSPGLAKHEPRPIAGGVGGHPGGDVAAGYGLDSKVETPQIVDWAVVNFIAFLGPSPHQEVLIRVDKVWLCRGQLNTITADN